VTQETILVVDDEPAILQVIHDRLDREGFEVHTAKTGEQALARGRELQPDLIILDLMLPDLDGFEVLRRLRTAGQDVPVIILTARDEDVDVVVGLELGADDYVAKPFNPRELVARIRVVLRRRSTALDLAGRVATLEAQIAAQEASAAVPERSGTGLAFDEAARRAWYAGQRLDLRPREYDLLLFLAQHRGQVLGRDRLLEQVWGTADYIDERTVDVHIHRLRQKLLQIEPGLDPIQTERGVGYRLDV
jgi:DNA-binding response OmpR family regulator